MEEIEEKMEELKVFKEALLTDDSHIDRGIKYYHIRGKGYGSRYFIESNIRYLKQWIGF